MNDHNDQVAIDKWNTSHSKRKLRMAKNDQWNIKHPNCPINTALPFFPVKWTYSPPVVSGIFSFPKHLLLKYPFLFEFTEPKLQCTLLRYFMNLVVSTTYIDYKHLLTAIYEYQTCKIATQRYKKYKKLKKGSTSFLQLCAPKNLLL